MEVFKLTLPDLDQVDFQIAFVDEPAIESNFLAFKKETIKYKFQEIDASHRKVMGYFMIADLEIPRYDPIRGKYMVTFPKDSVDKIVKNFAVNGLTKNLNEMHQTNQFAKGVYILNHWQINSELGITPPKGFDVEANGSWFGIIQCDNQDIYQKCIDGTYNGFSIESVFIEEKMKLEDELDLFLNSLKVTN